MLRNLELEQNRRCEAGRPRSTFLALLCTGALAGVLGCGGDEVSREDFAVPVGSVETPREPCAERDDRRVALFGDLHVHTALSSDAWNYDLDVRPHGAFGYAFGDPILLPPRDEYGRGSRPVRIDRPLDFAAITDHAEFLGEQKLCSDPKSPSYDADLCVGVREGKTPAESPLGFMIMNPFSQRDPEVCGDDYALCDAARNAGWQETIDAAEHWNDTSSRCERTAFIAYEYSSFRMGSNLHRNVIFRGRVVPKRPLSYIEAKREWELWESLRDQCNESGTGCEALAIPHNSNISNGRMFKIDYPGASGVAEQAARAALQIAMEPIVEVMQHKGDSECRRGLTDVLGVDDVLCDFEKFENASFRRLGYETAESCYDGPLNDWLPRLGPQCVSRRSYVRYALVDGLAEEDRIGVNPFKFGLMASTDTHNAMAGGVSERDWPGHLGVADGSPSRRLDTEANVSMGNYTNNPGGLIGVWATENSRGAIFDAMKRKEVFGTSGPRIKPRFYGGWDLPEDLCNASDPVAVADAAGVPMGGDLPPRSNGAAPSFAVWAERDPGTANAPGGLLQRIQIIKGWVDEEGNVRESVIDVAGGENGASADPATCRLQGPGHDTLCRVWRDPAFDPERRAVYYARVVENPSCRYSTWQCNAWERENPGAEKPPGCSDPLMQQIQQERAWTSPIWFSPGRS